MKRLLATACGCIALLTLGGAALAQAFPERPIRIVVGFPPGGSVDVMARALAVEMGRTVGQPVFVENKAGGGSMLATQYVKSSPPDGYTLQFTGTPLTAMPYLYANVPFRADDFVLVSRVLSQRLVLVVSNQLGIDSPKALIAHARQNPGKLNYAVSAMGGSPHFTGRLFTETVGIKVTEINYKGAAPALQDIMSGTADLMFDSVSTAIPLHRAGKLKILAVAGDSRLPTAPDIPTLRELGYDVSFDTWLGITAPKGVPAPVLDRLNKAIRQAVASPEFATRAQNIHSVPVSSSLQESSDFVRDNDQFMKTLIAKSGMKLD